MESILKDLPGLIIYQDDVLVHAPTRDSLAKRVTAVIKRLEQKNVSINEQKSVLVADKIDFLGHELSSDGIRPSRNLTDKLLSCQPPRSVKELHSFLGLANYFGRMIPDYSTKVAPLNELRKKGVPFIWKNRHQEAFDALLSQLSEPPVLQPYSISNEATLTCDASENSVAAILTQKNKPVIYVSRSLSAAEKNYSNVEREALAAVWGITRLRHLLLGRKFTLVSDHRPLLRIFGGKGLPKVASARLVRWALLLQPYDFTIHYAPGSAIPHADALTRLRHARHFPEDDLDLVINNVAFETDETVVDIDRVRHFTESDKVAQSVMKRIRSGKWSSCSPLEIPFKRARDALTIENSMIYLSTRVYVPLCMRRDLFNAAHTVHSGIHSTLNRMKFSVWWPSMNADVSKWVSECNTCSHLRPRLGRERGHWPEAQPFERLNADWCQIEGVGNVLVIVDSGSGWIEAFRHRERTSASVISSLREVCSRFGVPRTFVTDNAAEFTSVELNQWCQTNGVEKMESPPYEPATNGTAERGVQTVKRGMRAWRLSTLHQSFDTYLKRLLFHYRTCCKRPNGKSPAEIVFGRPVRVPVISRFTFGQKVTYQPAGQAPRPSSFMMQRGSNTSWILDETDSRVILAHANQLAPSGVGTAPTVPPAEEMASAWRPDPQIPAEAGATEPAPAPISCSTQPSNSDSMGFVPRRSERSRTVRHPVDYDDL